MHGARTARLTPGLLVLVLSLALAGPAFVQQSPAPTASPIDTAASPAAAAAPAAPVPAVPGPEFDVLKAFLGKWTSETTMAGQPAQKERGKAEFEITLGGMWITEDFEGFVAGKRFRGRCYYTYDPASKKYVSVWVDSTTTRPFVAEGTYDATSKTLTLSGKTTGPDGKVEDARTVAEFKDDGTILWTMAMIGADGKENPTMSITYTRKARKSPRRH